MLLSFRPLHLCAAVWTGPFLWVLREADRVTLLPGSLLLRSHGVKLLLGGRSMFCSTSSASRTSAALRHVGLLQQNFYPLLETLIVLHELLDVLESHQLLLC